MSKDSPRTSVLRDNDLIRRGDALKALDWGDIYGRNAQDAINAIPAVQPTVKPLVWKGDSIRVTAKGMGKYYACMRMFHGQKGAGWEDDEGDWHPSLEAAKAAAQADYEARILSALTTGKEVMPNDDGNSNARPATSPCVTAGAVSPDAAALVDAAEKVINSYWNSTDGVITGIYDLETALARVKGEIK